MAIQSLTDLKALINSTIQDNTTNDISGSDVQTALINAIDTLDSLEGFINVHKANGQTTITAYGSKALARAAVPDDCKKEGVVIAYKISTGWLIEQNLDATAGTWGDDASWQTIGPVSVSQNTSTGHTDINIGSDSYPVASVEETEKNAKQAEDLLHTNTLYGKVLHIKDNNGSLIEINGSDNFTICGKNLFDQSSILVNKIKNDNGVEVADSGSSYCERYIAIPKGSPIKHLRANFQIQRIYIYDSDKNFVKRIHVFSDGILLFDRYNGVEIGFVQIQVANSSVTNEMMIIFDENLVSPQPSYESFAEYDYNSISSNELYIYDNSLQEINIKYQTSRTINDFLLVASLDSLMRENADVVTDGRWASGQINSAISATRKKQIIFASDSIFTLTAPIQAIDDNMSFISSGAKFTTVNQSLWGLNSAVSAGSNIINIGSESWKNLSYGTYLIIKEGDIWETAYVIAFAEGGNIILSKNLTNNYSQSAKVSNVSSAFEAKDLKWIKYRGLHIDWNYENNPRCPETTWAQNGISIGASDSEHYGSCSDCEVTDCIIENGGRHGILVRFANGCIVKNNRLSNWGEHCIDIAYAWTTESPIQNHIVANNICKGAENNGIQLHGGSGCIIDGNICFENSAGIGMLEYTHDNTIANNKCYANSVGIAIYNHASNITIIGNEVINNVSCGVYISTTSDSLVSSNSIIGNGGTNSNGGGIVINGETVDSTPVYASRNTISNNVFKNNKGLSCIYLSLCNRYIVEGNNSVTDDNTVDFVLCYYSKGGKIEGNFITNFRYVCNGGNWNIVNDNALSEVTGVLNNNGQYSVERSNDILQYID